MGSIASQDRTQPAANSASATPIQILVGAPLGSSTNTTARTFASELGKLQSRTILVENHTGAGGNIAAQAVAKAALDGNTLLVSSTSHATDATLYPSLPFDSIKDFTPITCVATSPSMLVGGAPFLSSQGPARTDSADQDQAGSAQFRHWHVGLVSASGGRGFQDSIGHLHRQHSLPAYCSGNSGRNGGKGRKRLPAFPDVSAIGELLNSFEFSAWFGLLAPARMEAGLLKSLSDAVRKAIALPEVRRRVESEGSVPVGNSPDEFSAFVNAKIPRWTALVKFSGINSGTKPE